MTSSGDGLLHPKSLQHCCLEFLASLIIEASSILRRASRGQGSLRLHDHVHHDEHQLLLLQEQHWQKGKGRESTHFQAEHCDDGETIYFTLRHMKAYIGMDGVLGSEGTLPAHFCDQILAHLASRRQLTDFLVSCVCHRSFGCTTKFPHKTGSRPLTLDTLVILARQPLVELSLQMDQYRSLLHAPISWRGLSSVLADSPVCFTLRSLSLSNARLEEPDLNFEWLSRLQYLMRLQFSNLILPSKSTNETSLAIELNKLPCLTVFSITRSTVKVLPCKNTNTLKQLTLSNAPLNTKAVLLADVLSLRNLISLDIARTSSISDQNPASSLQATDWVTKLSQMPQLRYLDLSRCLVSIEDVAHFDPPHHRMSFLGLLSTQACMRRDINSDVVAGDADEKQLLISLQTYRDRSSLLRHALYKLYEELEVKRINTSNNDIIQALLLIMERSQCDESSTAIYTSASACLYHFLTKEPLEEHLTELTTRKIITVLLKTLEGLLHESTHDIQDQDHRDQAIINMVLCLSCFSYPNSVLFVYSRMGKLLVSLAKYDARTVSEKAIVIMDAFVWQVSLDKKQMMKTYKGIEAVIDFITNRIQDQKSQINKRLLCNRCTVYRPVYSQCDFCLECAWSFLWNVTDETPTNCAEVLDCNGLQVLVDCYEMFKDEEDIAKTLRNMLGALGNVAEVDSLRPRLLNAQLLHILVTVMRTFHVLEVQYNISGIIVNLAMEDERHWLPIQQPNKDYLLDLVVSSVQQWDLTEQIEIQYRSLLPIIRTVEYHDDRVALCGVWALAHLCQSDTTKYTPMFLSEGGREAVEELRQRTSLPLVQELATKVLTITEQNKKARVDD